MGPWPGFIGLVFDEKAFYAEMKRLDIKKPGNFLGSERAHATMHHLVSKGGQVVYLLALGSVKGRSKEMVAGLVAHEAIHIIQQMQEDIAGGDSLGREAEAYLVQMIVQEALQSLWKSNKVRRLEPLP